MVVAKWGNCPKNFLRKSSDVKLRPYKHNFPSFAFSWSAALSSTLSSSECLREVLLEHEISLLMLRLISYSESSLKLSCIEFTFL